LETVFSRHEVKYYKTVVRGRVRASESLACIGAGIAKAKNSGTCAFDEKSIQSTGSQSGRQRPLGAAVLKLGSLGALTVN